MSCGVTSSVGPAACAGTSASPLSCLEEQRWSDHRSKPPAPPEQTNLYLTSSTLRKIALNLVVSASRFFANSECPVCAPFSLCFVFASDIRVAKTFSRAPEPDISSAYGLASWMSRESEDQGEGLD